MEIVFQSHRVSKPVLSIVLLDWSCRESFHIFDCLAAQQVARDKFENPALKELRLGRDSSDGLLERAVLGRSFDEWRVSKMRLEAIKLGKMALRKFLPRSVKTYVRERFQERRRIRSEQ